MIIIKEEFKAFVRAKPELVSYVSSGEMTWQKFYEIWNLYGNDEKVWEKYKEKNINESKKTSDSFTFSSLIEHLKKVDMNFKILSTFFISCHNSTTFTFIHGGARPLAS